MTMIYSIGSTGKFKNLEIRNSANDLMIEYDLCVYCIGDKSLCCDFFLQILDEYREDCCIVRVNNN